MSTKSKQSTDRARRVARAKIAAKRCQHRDQFIVYPGEVTIDSNGLMREDDMRLQCPDCNRVVTYTGP